MTVDGTGLPLGGRGLSLSDLRALALPLVVGLAFQPWSAFAQSFTVVDGQTTGQQAMFNAGDIGVIELGGTVSQGGGLAGVIMGAVDQMLDNAGSIATTGPFGYGIYSLATDATIDNSGSITTADVLAMASTRSAPMPRSTTPAVS